MKVNKQLVQEVANGKYDSYDTHGEMKRAAQRILEEKVVSKFSTFCFRMFGGELPDNVMDVFDAFVDFSLHGAELRVQCDKSIHPSGLWRVPGMTFKDSLKKLFVKTSQDEGLLWNLYRKEFSIEGVKGKFVFEPTAFHYCFAKGRINEKEMLEMCRAA